MNRKEIYLSFILFSIAFVVLLITLYPYRPNSTTPNIPEVIVKYQCPAGEYVDCMPGPGPVKIQCQSDYLDWATINCPNFKGAAQ